MSERARGKAPKALRTSDVMRPRMLAISALGAALGVGIVLAAERAPLGSERAVARPHAKLACASCHEAATAPSASSGPAPAPYLARACTTCHGAGHASTRLAHRALVAKGELPCAACHAQHSGGQGITFEADGFVRWGAGSEVRSGDEARARSGVTVGAIARGTTVPLVSLGACGKCHDPSRAADPIAACVPGAARARARGGADAGAGARASGEASDDAFRRTASQCFDEHVRLGQTPPSLSSGAGPPPCAAQHQSSRFVAWDAAREIAATTPWVAASKGSEPERLPWSPAAGALVGALVLGVAASAADRRRRALAAGGGGSGTKAPAVAAERKRLPTINPQTCLGCYACVDACPFDVLTIDKYVAVVARPNECCGVVLCEQVCPNGSLRVADGEPILDRPATTEDLESRDVPGLYIAGDLTGLPLIKNAINQGARAVDHIAATLPRARPRERGQIESFDVLVVGAGPAGLSAALRAKERGLSCVVVEQATVAASIKSFPRDKIVHDPPLDLPVEGELWLKEATKEELVAQWTRIVRVRALEIREGHRVVDLAAAGTGTGGGFSVRVAIGAAGSEPRERELHASRVVLAIGRRGTPRRLDAEIEPGAEDRIAYALADARSFEGKRVVVVGLGDAAMEAAIAIGRQPGASVTVSYRGGRFARGKAKNIRELESAIEQKKVKVLFETVPVAVSRTAVTFARTGAHAGRLSVGADAVLVLIGGLPPWDLLARAGIRRPKDPSAG